MTLFLLTSLAIVLLGDIIKYVKPEEKFYNPQDKINCSWEKSVKETSLDKEV